MSANNQNHTPQADASVNKSRMIGNYLVGKTLGEGTFGKVKQGTHQLTGEKVAIKILEKDRIVEVADVERVQREIHILKLVRHPHVIQLYEIIETPKHIFLVMEFVSGGEVFDYIVKNTKLKEVEGCKFLQELISGVEYLHRLKVVHRDLKPENLLLDHNKNIKIVDFGLSNTYKQNELLKTACGSPCYAAPEMIAGQKYTGLKVDIWSCGVILFASLCGYLPFEEKDQNTSALYKKILSGDYQLPKFLSPQGCDIIKGILNTDPEARFGIQEIKNHEWYQIYKRNYEIPPGIQVGYNRIPVDTQILAQLEQYGFQIDYAQKCLDANKHNPITTTYHLLLKKHLIEGGNSSADLNSQNFDIKLLEPKPRPQKPPISTLVNNEVIRQQLREDMKERSYSTEKEKFKRTNHHYRISDTGSSNDPQRQIIHEHDTSVMRIDNGPHSVQGKTHHKPLLNSNTGLLDDHYARFQHVSVSPAHQGKSIKKTMEIQSAHYRSGRNNQTSALPAPPIYNPIYKNRMQINSQNVKLASVRPIESKVKRQSSSKGKRPDLIADAGQGYRSTKDRSGMLDDLNTSHYPGRRQYVSNDRKANMSYDDSGRNQQLSGVYSAKNKRVNQTFDSKFLI